MAAKKTDLTPEESKLYSDAGEAMGVWHEDRKEWADRGLRSLTLVNAGGAVTMAAFIGTAFSKSGATIGSEPILSLVSFTTGLAIVLVYTTYRFLWAEYRVWYLRWLRGQPETS